MNTAPTISIRDNRDTQIGVLYGYFNDSIELYLEGKASVLTLSVLDENNYRELLEKGNSLSFTYDSEDYHMTIVKRDEDEDVLTITAWSLVLELNNETKAPYEGKSLTFAQYLNAFDGEKILTLNINEVSDKKISYKWDSQQSMLERLFSLAKVFSAEIEFNPILADDGSLSQLEVNVYKAHDTNNQGLGEDKSSQVFYFGQDITTVKKTSDIMNLYTAIRPVGKDGLNLKNYTMTDVKDDEGNVLYYLKNGMLYAPQAREQFPSNLINKTDGWTVYDWSTEYTTQATLCGNALTKLKELSVPATTWTIEGYIDAKIGDTISVQDDGYTPTLLLVARVNSQKLSMTDPSVNETTFSNVEQVQSEISADLIAKMNELINEKVQYTASLITTNGVSFKNGEGSTTLKARVFSGGQDVTSEVTTRWYKNDAFTKTAYELEVKASDITDKAVYRFDVVDTFGNVKTMSEVTIFNVDDGTSGVNGKTSYFHVAYSNSADGKADFSITDSTNKLFLGTYTDFTQADSTDPSKYYWTLIKGEKGDKGLQGLQGKDGKQGIAGEKGKDGITYYTHIAYANSSDGKTDFSVSNPDRIFIGMYVDTVQTDSTDPTKYAWTLVKGAKGDQGLAGTKGTDGKTPYFHTAWANSKDGKIDFSTSVSLGKKYLGTYTDFTQADSTDPTKYRWTETSNAIYLHTAWAWSEDGTDRFTKVYPNENFFTSSTQIVNKLNVAGIARNNVNGFDFTGGKDSPRALRIPDAITGNGKWTVSGYVRGSQSVSVGFTLDICDRGMTNVLSKADNSWTYFSVTFDVTNYTSELYNFVDFDNITHWAYYFIKDFKIEKGSVATPWAPLPEDDFENAYPKYKGTSTKDSNDPKDYDWYIDPTWLQLRTDKNLSDKVDGNQYQEDRNQTWEEIGNRVTKEEAQEIRDIAQGVLDSYNGFVDEGGRYQQDLESLEARSVAMTQKLADKVANWEFIDTWMSAGEEGLSISSKTSSMKILISKDKISFSDGGQVVAYFTNQEFKINRGAIVDSLQVGQHKMVRLSNDHTIFQWVQT